MITKMSRLLTLSALTLLSNGAIFAAADDLPQLPAQGVILDSTTDKVLTNGREGAICIAQDGSLSHFMDSNRFGENSKMAAFLGKITPPSESTPSLWVRKSEESAEQKCKNRLRALTALQAHQQ